MRIIPLALLATMSTGTIECPIGSGGPHEQPTTLAVLGDTPYGDELVADFPNLVRALNETEVDFAVHVGDIKSGSSACTDAYFAGIRADFDSLEVPLVYTPGDNEWTDCHRSAAGKYNPLERLQALREFFFSEPGVTLGTPKLVESQAFTPGYEGFPENQLWLQSNVVFSAIHVVGSNNDLQPWFVDDENDDLLDDPEAREAEFAARNSAAIAWLEATFAKAEARDAAGVVIFAHADMWSNGAQEGFVPFVRRMAELTREFGRPVLHIEGDSHSYLVDNPLENGDLDYGVDFPLPNFTRIVVEGVTTTEWLEVTVDPTTDAVFSWERIQR